MPDPSAVIASGIQKRYKNSTVVDGISFEVSPGRIVGVLGRNGAGKTTLLKILLGLVTPDAGSVSILGTPPGASMSRRVGVAMETLGFIPGATVARELSVWARALDVESTRVDHLLDLVDLVGHEKKRCSKLSTGQQQRLRLATALLSPDLELLVLDEPANGLDPDGIRWLRKLLRSMADQGTTVVVSSHQLSEMENTVDDVLLIDRGRLIRDAPLAEITRSGTRSLEDEFFALTERGI